MVSSTRLNIDKIKNKLKDINPNIEIISNEYENNRTLLKCQCLIDGNVWDVSWANLSMGKGCPQCSGNKKLSLEIIKQRLKELNPDLEILSNVYINTSAKLSCRCNLCGHEWESKWDNLYRRHRCPNCCTHRKDYDIEDIKKIMSNLNENIIVVSDKYTGYKGKLTFKCVKCNRTWESGWSYMKTYKECCYCKTIKSTEKLRLELKKVKPNISLIDNEYKNTFEKLTFKCNICGYTWLSSWHNVNKPTKTLNLTGCPSCNGYRKDIDISYIKEKLKSVNPYIKILANTYTNNETPIKCECQICGYVWFAKWSKLSIGRGCKNCNTTVSERTIMVFLNENNIKHIREFTFKDLKGDLLFLRFDFAIFDNEDLLYLIEYDGEFHYKKYYEQQNFDRQQRYDKLKNEYCIKNNIPLIRIPYWEKDNISEILTDIFICKNTNNKFIINNQVESD